MEDQPKFRKISIVTAVDNDALIGIKEYGSYSLPWPYLKDDMNFFNQLTNTTNEDNQVNAIIVGYHTWTTLTDKFKNSNKRIIIIISKTYQTDPSTLKEIFVGTFNEAVECANNNENVDNIFVIGGSSVYHATLCHPQFHNIYLTHIDHSYPTGNVVDQKIYFPVNHKTLNGLIKSGQLELNQNVIKGYDISKNINYTFKKYTVKNFGQFHKTYIVLKNGQFPYYSNYVYDIVTMREKLEGKTDEHQYLKLVKKIMDVGIVKQTRNAVTKSIFGYQLTFDLSKGYPLSTVKKSYPKAIFEELMWFIRGQTNVKILQEKGVHIWDKNSSKEFLEANNLPYQEADIGPGYGFQMRHHGAKYVDCTSDYTGQGIDQLHECVDLINNNPGSRRIMIDLWNPSDVKSMALPVCHVLYNFGVDLYDKPSSAGKRGKLNCHFFQRSWDVFLGWNTSTAALLTYILAQHCDLDAGILVHSVTDAHLYQNHIDSGAVATMLDRIPRVPPKLRFLKKHEKIEDYQYDDLVLEDYYPCPAINVEMVA